MAHLHRAHTYKMTQFTAALENITDEAYGYFVYPGTTSAVHLPGRQLILGATWRF
ncbi:MAG TPA: hypothetical protein VF618_25695 [Thermoanaerobaculia bacterium]